jgi:EAL domain-containing protein (putative c-di-GMP-specific phosphodiesterase class I)
VLGNVPPLDVIPLAEEMGLIGVLGGWVLRTACAQGAAWNAKRAAADLPPLTIAVNLSPAQIEDSLLETVRVELDRSGLPAGCLLLEVTETTYMEPTSAAPEVLARLRELGVRIAIDDFGTGFSSFDRLRRFPADVLKIDRSFVAALDDGPAASAIVQAMIDLAHAVGSTVVAEGVERQQQADALSEAGCALFQGWLYAPARPVADLDLLLTPDLGSSSPVPAAREPMSGRETRTTDSAAVPGP